jgi:hypothetical protein
MKRLSVVFSLAMILAVNANGASFGAQTLKSQNSVQVIEKLPPPMISTGNLGLNLGLGKPAEFL